MSHVTLALLAYVQGFAHRDLKSANVLYNKEDMRAKVTDFGMSRSLNEMQNTAPALQNEPQDSITAYMTAQCGTRPTSSNLRVCAFLGYI